MAAQLVFTPNYLSQRVHNFPVADEFDHLTPAALLSFSFTLNSFPFLSFLPPTTPMAAEFSNLVSPESDSDGDGGHSAAVDAIVSQAIDSVTLEQIAALNSSHLSSSSSSLPTNLEARFQKLKSFPVPTTSRPRTLKSSTKSLNQCKSASAWPASDTEPVNEAEITPSANPNSKKSSEQTPREFLPSPPRRACCFGCSSSKKKPKDKRLKGRDWGKNEEILTDFSTFSFKEQQRKLKAALKEEEKVSREAARVVEWVKQASARMDVSAIDELVLSEDEKYYK